MSELPSLAEVRREYVRRGLRRVEMDADPLAQFDVWLAEALALIQHEANAMSLATATPEGRPSVRTVLLKGRAPEGFLFFTNYASRKGRELFANPQAALLWHWKELERQIIIEGAVEKIARAVSVAYFHSRPRGSQLGALISRQSEPLASREVLEQRLAEAQAQYGVEQEIPMPEEWGGFLLRPTRFEFWQGRENRLHDRLEYRRGPGGGWELRRLSP